MSSCVKLRNTHLLDSLAGKDDLDLVRLIGCTGAGRPLKTIAVQYFTTLPLKVLSHEFGEIRVVCS